MITLSAEDRRDLEQAMHTLLAPLEYASLDVWRAEAMCPLRRAFRSDVTGFMLPKEDGADLFSEEVGGPIARNYPDQVHSLDHLVDAYERGAELGVYTTAMLWGEHLETYYESAYYNEIIRPSGAASVIAATVPMEEPISEDTVGQLVVSRTDQRPAYGPHDVEAFRLLLPAFRAGLTAWSRLHAQRAALFRTLDAVGTPMRCCDESGATVHQTPALTRLLAADPEREAIQAQVKHVARRIARCRSGCDVDEMLATPVDRVIQTRGAAYRVTGTVPDPELQDLGVHGLVIVERITAPVVPLERLQERFDLTPRQAEVAQLLAQRKTNREIADALAISPHTARHHTEAVLRKLNLDARTKVRDYLHRHLDSLC